MSIPSYSHVLPTGHNVFTVFNMSDDVLQKIESRMYPGGCSAEGFLAEGERLKDVCVNDLTTLANLGIGCDQIGDTLKAVIMDAEKQTLAAAKDIASIQIGKVVKNILKIDGTESATCGYQECPFQTSQEQCHIGRNDYVITNLRTNESITISSLAIAMIGKHAFFEGHTSYHVDPEKLCRVLQLKPEQYKRITKENLKWVECGDACEDRSQKELVEIEESAKKTAETVFQYDANATAYFGVPYKTYDTYKYKGMTEYGKIVAQAKEKNKSNESIQRTVDFHKSLFKNWNPNAQVFVDNGKKYTHIFNHKQRTEEDSLVKKFDLHYSVDIKGSFVFESQTITYASLDYLQ